MYNFTQNAIDIKHDIVTIYNKNAFVSLLKNKKSEEIAKLATSSDLMIENLFNKISNQNELECVIRDILDYDKNTHISKKGDVYMASSLLGTFIGVVQTNICKNFDFIFCFVVSVNAIVDTYSIFDHNIVNAMISLYSGYLVEDIFCDFGMVAGAAMNGMVFSSIYLTSSVLSNINQFDCAISHCLESHDDAIVNSGQIIDYCSAE